MSSIPVFSMFSCITAFLFAALFSAVWSPVTQAKMFADCTFGEVKSREGNEETSSNITLIGKLPSSRNLSHSCVVKTEKQNSVLYLRAKRRKESKEGESDVTFVNCNI